MIFPYLKLISKKNFALLWFGQITSQFGDRLTQIALVAVVGSFFKDTTSSGLAIIFSMTIIPTILFSPATGVCADRWDKRKVMYICDFFRFLVIMLIPLFFLKPEKPGFFPVICVIVFISSTLGRFFIPTKMAFIPQLVKKNEIFLANTVIAITAMGAAAFGIGLGGIIVDGLGLRPAFYVDAFTFFASASFIFFIKSNKEKHLSPSDIVGISKGVVENIKKSFLKEITDGIKYIITTKGTRYAFRTFIFLFSYLGALSTVYVSFIQTTLGTSSQQVKEVAFVVLSIGVGAFFGSLIYGRLGHKVSIKKIINLSTLLASLFLLFFIIRINHSQILKEAIILNFFLGLLISPILTGINSLIHNEIEETFLGRTFSNIESISHLGFLIAMFVTSFLADQIAFITPFTIIISVGIIGSLFSIFFMISDAKNRGT